MVKRHNILEIKDIYQSRASSFDMDYDCCGTSNVRCVSKRFQLQCSILIGFKRLNHNFPNFLTHLFLAWANLLLPLFHLFSIWKISPDHISLHPWKTQDKVYFIIKDQSLPPTKAQLSTSMRFVSTDSVSDNSFLLVMSLFLCCLCCYGFCCCCCCCCWHIGVNVLTVAGCRPRGYKVDRDASEICSARSNKEPPASLHCNGSLLLIVVALFPLFFWSFLRESSDSDVPRGQTRSRPRPHCTAEPLM